MKVTGSHPQPLKRTGGENEDTKYYSSGKNKRETTESLARAWGEKKPDLPHKVTEFRGSEAKRSDFRIIFKNEGSGESPPTPKKEPGARIKKLST